MSMAVEWYMRLSRCGATGVKASVSGSQISGITVPFLVVWSAVADPPMIMALPSASITGLCM
jgi:hypothetical protein